LPALVFFTGSPGRPARLPFRHPGNFI